MAKHRKNAKPNDPTEMIPMEGTIDADDEFLKPSKYVQHVGNVTRIPDDKSK